MTQTEDKKTAPETKEVPKVASEPISEQKNNSTEQAVRPALATDEVVLEKDKVNFTEGGVENFKFYPDNPENHRHKYRWVHKEPTKFYDPCEQSRQASISCILRNQEDRTVCQDFFDAYKECRRDFFRKRKEDRIKGKGGWGFW